MIAAVLILTYIVVIYLSFITNVFQLGLLLFDNADGEAFTKLSDRKRKSLNDFFGSIASYGHFVTLFDNICTILSSAIAIYFAGKLATRFEIPFAVIAALVLIVTLLLNFIIAQTLSKRVPNRWIERTLRKHVGLVRMIYTILSPIVWMVEKLAGKYKRDQLSEEQKEDMVERAIETLAGTAGIEEPIVEEDEKEMIGNIFELDQTALKEIMVPRTEIVGIPSNATFPQFRKIVDDSGHSRFPVYGDDLDELKGIIYVKDLFVRSPIPDEEFDLSCYVRKAHFVPETKLTSDLLEELKRSRNHMAIVVDEYGGTAGLVTMEDLIEVIVGDIQDEHDPDESEIVRLEDGSFRVDANIAVEKLAEEAGYEFENGQFETVGGLIYDLVGSLPREGESVENDFFVFTVEKMDGQRIDLVNAKPKIDSSDDSDDSSS